MLFYVWEDTQGLLKSFLSYASQLSGAKSCFLIVQILIPCITIRAGDVADNCFLCSPHPPKSSVLIREEVADGCRIAGIVLPGLRWLCHGLLLV